MRITGTAAVYPRWRGEHFLGNDVICSSHGLSPLARGTHPEINGDGAFTRFIPAGAGNTHSLARLNQLSPVYPRWRGEHSEYFADLFTDRGLSPLARGTRGNSFLDAALLRFIPAGAGNTLPSLVDEKSITVYPRWRGEH